MTLAARIKRLEAQRTGAGLGSVAFDYDAKGELIGARVMRWDGVRFSLERATGERAEAFGFRAAIAAGDFVTIQSYVLALLRREHGRVHQG